MKDTRKIAVAAFITASAALFTQPASAFFGMMDDFFGGDDDDYYDRYGPYGYGGPYGGYGGPYGWGGPYRRRPLRLGRWPLRIRLGWRRSLRVRRPLRRRLLWRPGSGAIRPGCAPHPRINRSFPGGGAYRRPVLVSIDLSADLAAISSPALRESGIFQGKGTSPAPAAGSVDTARRDR